MEVRNYLRSARGPQDAERAYSLIAAECERGMVSLGAEPVTFTPWSQLVIRAQSDSAAVARVQQFAELLQEGRSLTPENPDHAVASAIALAYGFGVKGLDLTKAVASLSAGWCWLQWLELDVEPAD